MKLFNPDSPVAQRLSALADMMLLNLCWLAASLPLVTIGASCTAMYAVLGRRMRGEGGTVIPAFFHALRENWKTATRFWLTQAVATGALAIILLTAIRRFELWGIAAGLLIWTSTALLIVLTVVCSLIYPQIARFENSWQGYVRNALILAAVKAGWSAANLCLFALPVWLLVSMPGLFLRTGFIWPLVGMSALFWCSARLMRHVLAPLEQATV